MKTPVGKWRLIDMEQWDQDFIDLVEPGYIAFKRGGTGEMVFGAVNEGMRPFVVALITHGLSRSTINRHMNSLWLLGGEIVARTHCDAGLERKTGQDLLLAFVDDDGGPLSRHNNTEAEQRAFDSTCRKLYRFLCRKPDDAPRR